jgi:DNA-binding response OmpR family regulator
MQLLLIEDHNLLTRALRHVFEEEGHTVKVVRDAGTPDSKVRTAEYDVIILDLVRCKEDGLALLGRWRRAGLKTPVLALIAPGETVADADLLNPQVDDYLTMPFEIDELMARLGGVVGAGSRKAGAKRI